MAYKTKSGNLVKVVNGVKFYYNRKLKKWVRSKYQPKKKSVKAKSTRKRKATMKQKVYLAERRINRRISSGKGVIDVM